MTRASHQHHPRHLLVLLGGGLGASCLSWLGAVRADEEVHEEPEKRLDVDHVEHWDLGWHARASTRHHQVPLHVHRQELDHLHGGQVLLPPDVAGVGTHEVVHVHDGVDEAVQDDGGVDISIISDTGVHVVNLPCHQQQQQQQSQSKRHTHPFARTTLTQIYSQRRWSSGGTRGGSRVGSTSCRR